jgi:hypothetical protein
MLNKLDIYGTLRARAHKGLRASRSRIARSVAIAIGITLLSPMAPANTGSIDPNKKISYKTYALRALNNDYHQFNCLLKLYTKESNWRPKARNGSHYGIPQGRSTYLASVNGYKQIDWGLKYIYHRHNTPCGAWQHFKKRNWH